MGIETMITDDSVKTTISADHVIKVVNKEHDKAIIRAIQEWASEDSVCRSATLLDEDALTEILQLGIREYSKLHKNSL